MGDIADMLFDQMMEMLIDCEYADDEPSWYRHWDHLPVIHPLRRLPKFDRVETEAKLFKLRSK